jgi:predicted transcriptional regulator
LEIIGDLDGDGKVTSKDIIKTTLKQNGDFRSDECVELLKEADIVCTNPPFSLFREYIEQLIKYKKKFLVIGNNNAVTYKEIFKLIKDKKL